MMPGAIKMSRHYSSQRAFRRDEESLAAEGWAVDNIHAGDHTEGPLAFLGLGRRPVDVDYVRDEWPTE